MEQFDKMLRDMARQEKCAAPEGFDGRLREVLDDLPPRAGKRRGLGAAKGALIAAAACAALLGTAFAAVELAGVRIADFFNNEPRVINDGWEPEVYSGYIAEGDINYYPMDALSPELREIGQNQANAVSKSFSSWADMEQFIGVALMDNSVLAGAPGGIQWCADARVSGEYVACVNVKDGAVPRIWMYGSYLLHPGKGSYAADNSVSIQLEADLYTENAVDPQYHTHRYYFPEGTTVSQKEYTAPSGLPAKIIRIDRLDRTEYNAEFSLNGVLFTVRASCCEDDGFLLETLLEVLDGFAV